MSNRIVIAGASGFIGRYLARSFAAEGSTVSLIGRRSGRSGRADATWGDTAGIVDLLDGADLLINLAGKSVNCRYTEQNRAEILRSRVETTRELSRGLRACENPPSLWINSSTATIYRHAEDRPMAEDAGELGEGFSVGVARSWEETLFDGDLPGVRRVALRMAIVLGDGSALIPLIRLAQVGLGGPQLDGRWFSTASRLSAGTFHRFRARGGRQRFSWIHIADVVGIVKFLRVHAELDGVINASSPNPSDNVTVMRTLRDVLGVPIGLSAPRWMLEFGSMVIRTETELVLKSRWVVPERLLDAGFEFAYPDLAPALRDIIATRRLGTPSADRTLPVVG
jgi:NAD dependent epimerase/dehydratase family enzyme